MLYDKETYMAIAETYNKNVRRDKKYDIGHAYADVIGEKWPYGSGYDKEYASIIRDFLDTVHAESIYLRRPLLAPNYEDMELKLYPHAIPAIRTTGAESCKNILPLKDKKQSKYHVIGVIGEWVYASDAHVMVKIRDTRWTAFDGKEIPYSDIRDILKGKKTAGLGKITQPYESVLRKRRKSLAKCNCSVRMLTELAYGAWLAGKDVLAVVYSLRIEFSKTVSCDLRPDYLFHILYVLLANGAEQVELHLTEQILELHADNGNAGLVMLNKPNGMNYPRLVIKDIQTTSCKIKKQKSNGNK